jgi:hypothetical protein
MERKAVPELDRRICERFQIPGATVSYKKKGLLRMGRTFAETSCPLVEISYNGVRFLNRKELEPDQEILVEILSPANETALTLKGKVIWSEAVEGNGYHTGIQFYPYGRKKGENEPRKLSHIKRWAEKYVNIAET